MPVRLSRDPKRLDARLNELSRDLAKAAARADRAQNLRSNLASQLDAILKSMRGRVSELALSYLQEDARRLAGFREWATSTKSGALLKTFLERNAPEVSPPKRRGRRRVEKTAAESA